MEACAFDGSARSPTAMSQITCLGVGARERNSSLLSRSAFPSCDAAFALLMTVLASKVAATNMACAALKMQEKQ
jgi:hypothetical protein